MGAACSFLISFSSNDSTDTSLKMGLGELPESCVAGVLMNLDPPQICKLAMLNRAFRGASNADFVWESKLPPNYAAIIQRLLDGGDSFDGQGMGMDSIPRDLSKRDIYSWLSRPRSFDSDTKKVWLDKLSGKVCLSISSSGLGITCVGDRRYWSRIPTEESRFGSIAYLQQIWWFEVGGEVEFPFPPGTYSLYFRLQLGCTTKRFGRRGCSLSHVHGWDKKPARFQLTTSDGQETTTQCYLNEPGKWIHHRIGDFVVANSLRPTKVKFSMTQIDCTHSKGGLCVDSVFVCPSDFKLG